MSKEREALKQALELLAVATYQSPDLQQKRTDVINAGLSVLAEQPAQKQEPKRWAVFCSECRKEWSVSYPHPGKSICAECDAKAGAQQQEPVSVMTVLHLKDRTEIGYGPASAGYDLPTGEYKLYTSPPASKPWVGLTDEERNKIWRDVIGWGDPSHDDEDLMKAIEAKLKERNT